MHYNIKTFYVLDNITFSYHSFLNPLPPFSANCPLKTREEMQQVQACSVVWLKGIAGNVDNLNAVGEKQMGRDVNK